MKIDKLHWGAIISLLTGLAIIGVLITGTAHGAPRYEDTLTAWQSLTAQMWEKGCRRFEPEFAEPLNIKVYVSAEGIISGIMNSKIRGKCTLYAIKQIIVDPPTEPSPGVTRVTWDAPTSRVNGVSLAATEIRGYSVLLNGVPIGFTAATIFEFATPATAGQVTLVAVDTNGLESIQSAPFKVGGA